MKRVVVFLLLSLIASSLRAQVECGTDLLPRDEELSSRLLSAINGRNLLSRSNGTVRTIPVVFHILHNGGPENVPDSVITNALAQLNARFRNDPPYDDPTGHPTDYQFCLASVDPAGMPTSGINRYWASSIFTTIGDLSVMGYGVWEPYLYCNIYVVYSISAGQYAGYAFLPGNPDQYIDGIVVAYNYLESYVLAHEMGHYLGLYHTFQSTCENDDCRYNGDYVCDTPPDSSRSGCRANSCSTELADTSGLSPFSSDVDELPNYMDYTSCPLSFSQGQCDRMWIYEDIVRPWMEQSPGCGALPPSPPVAAFTDSLAGECNEGVVYFRNQSTGYFRRYWDFQSDGIVDDSTDHPTFAYPATGTYTVQLTVKGPGGTATASSTVSVRKRIGPYYPLGGYNGPAIVNDTIHICRGTQATYFLDAGASYRWFDGSTGPSFLLIADTSFTFWFEMTDNSGYVWSNRNCRPIYVDVMPSPPPVSAYSNDTVRDCPGKLVTVYGVVPPGTYTYQWMDPYLPYPGATDSVFSFITSSWMNEGFALRITNAYGCTAQSNTIMISAWGLPIQQNYSATGDTLTANWGQYVQWYRDGMLIPGATGPVYIVGQPGCYRPGFAFWASPQCLTMATDSICFGTTDVAQVFREEIRVGWLERQVRIQRSNVTGSSTFRLFSTSGAELLRAILSRHVETIDADLAPGLYLWSVQSQQGTVNGKLMVH